MSTVGVLFHLHTSAVALARIGALNTSAAAKLLTHDGTVLYLIWFNCKMPKALLNELS